MAMLSSSLTQVLLDYSYNEKPSIDYAKRCVSSESSTGEYHLMVTYYLVQNKSPVVFVIFHPNGEENPRKTGDR